MATETRGSEAVIATVRAALAVTEVVSPVAPPTSAFLTMAVIAVTPLATAVNCPFVVATVATAVLLLPQVAWLVRFTVEPVPVVPMARYEAV